MVLIQELVIDIGVRCGFDSEDEIDGEPGVRIDAGVEMVRAFLFCRL